MRIRILAMWLLVLTAHSAAAGIIGLTDRISNVIYYNDAGCINIFPASSVDFEVFVATGQGTCSGVDENGDEFGGNYTLNHYSEKPSKSEILADMDIELFLEVTGPGSALPSNEPPSFSVFNRSQFDFTVDELSAGQIEFEALSSFGSFPRATLEADGVEVYNSSTSQPLERYVFSPNVNYRWNVLGSLILGVISPDVQRVDVVTRLKIEEDADQLADFEDNCIAIDNADQRDTDADGFGNICDADLNNDCIVNFQDVSILTGEYLGSDPDADLNGDGAVNFLDLTILRNYFLKPPGESGIPNICSS